MLKTTNLFLLLLLTLCIPIPGMASGNATILIYHRFGDDRYPTTNISTAAFAEQMDFLENNNYNVMPLVDLIDHLKNKREIPAKTVVITIDDAYTTVYDNAWPILRRHGYPFTIFVYTRGVDQNYGDYMNWTQLRELKKQGIDLQDHGFGHEHLAFRPENVDELGYRAWISNDMVKSMALFSRELGDTPRFFALPYGEYNQIVIEEAKDLGYEAVLNQDPGAVGSYTDLYHLPRQPILGDEWASMPHFEKILKLVDFPLMNQSPAPQQLPDALVSRYQATMINPDDYLPGSFGFWVSGLGWHQGQREGDTIFFTTDKQLQRPVNRVVVSAREVKSKKLATRTWMLIHPEGDRAGEK